VSVVAAGRPVAAAADRRPPGRAALAVTAAWVAVLVVAGAGLLLTGLTWPHLKLGDAVDNLGAAAGGIAYATLGTLILRRAGNLIGWFMIAEGAAAALLAAGSSYAIAGLAGPLPGLPAPTVAGALAECAFVPTVSALAAIFLLFPSGRLPSPRWRPAAAGGLVLTGVTLFAFVINPRQITLPAPGGSSLKFASPLAVRLPAPLSNWAQLGTLNGLGVVFAVLMVPTVVSLVLRYRHGDQRLRQQMKWLALAIGVVLVCQLAAVLAIAAGDPDGIVVGVAYDLQPLTVLLVIPVTMAVAILRYQLFDIDVIISRALRYALLSAAITAVYAGIVLGLGTLVGHRGGPLLTIVAAVVIAAAFQPLRERARQLANRLVYGVRATPYQVLSDFAAGMAGQLDLTSALDRMLALLAGAAGAVRAEAWIRVGAELRPAAAWPPDAAMATPVPFTSETELPALGTRARVVPVRHGNETLGAITLEKPANEPLTSAEDGLLRHLASQAGLVLRNTRLTADLRATIDELRASRRRLVEAQDAERRKIERNLHDGAQQQLVALTIQLSLLADAADDPDLIRQLVPELTAELRTALADLRDLARGIYPPLLADQGLVVALRTQAAKCPVPVQLEADQVGRYPQDAESTVYFCALEALQNVVKHARASAVTIRLAGRRDALEFSISDDGQGFSTRDRSGSGLQGMSDRLAAHGGTLEVSSRPGYGTTISGRLPARARAGTPDPAGVLQARGRSLPFPVVGVLAAGAGQPDRDQGHSHQHQRSGQDDDPGRVDQRVVGHAAEEHEDQPEGATESPQEVGAGRDSGSRPGPGRGREAGLGANRSHPAREGDQPPLLGELGFQLTPAAFLIL
jgi:signal transduction histidine kinase